MLAPGAGRCNARICDRRRVKIPPRLRRTGALPRRFAGRRIGRDGSNHGPRTSGECVFAVFMTPPFEEMESPSILARSSGEIFFCYAIASPSSKPGQRGMEPIGFSVSKQTAPFCIISCKGLLNQAQAVPCDDTARIPFVHRGPRGRLSRSSRRQGSAVGGTSSPDTTVPHGAKRISLGPPVLRVSSLFVLCAGLLSLIPAYE